MKCACCRGFLSSGIAVLGLVGLGFGGYNVITTGCPLGSCHKGDAPVTAVSTTSANASSCPFTGKSEAHPQTPCCEQGEMAAKAQPAQACPVHAAKPAPAAEPVKDPA